MNQSKQGNHSDTRVKVANKNRFTNHHRLRIETIKKRTRTDSRTTTAREPKQPRSEQVEELPPIANVNHKFETSDCVQRDEDGFQTA